ncbi:MAG TPA: hypothetical protein VES79_06340 [Solirubrobacteraceae bacterium]|nr:hypothetical protein [Solirubrobacteraceae bacterium]
MTDALTPDQALDYLRALSADIRDGVVLGADGRMLAGPPELADPARALLAAANEADDIEVATSGACVFAARSDRHAIVLACGCYALPALVRYDLRAVLGDLAGRRREAA